MSITSLSRQQPKSTRPSSRRFPAVAGVLSLALALAACSSGTNNAGSGGSSPSGGSPKATGSPIVIGMINQENTPAGSFPEMRQAEQAAIGYVNSNGGVKGHPLSLNVCVTDGSPSASASCANQMVADHVALVTMGVDFGTSGSLPILTKAGIPLIGGEPLLPPELTSKDAIFFVGGSAGAFPSQDAYIGQVLHAKKVSIIYTANPAGLAAATSFGKALLIKAGVPAAGIKLVGAAADATDFTPAVTAANADHPDVIMVLFAALGCSRIMQAKESLGVQAKMFYAGSCLDKSVVTAGGPGANGAYFNAEWIPYNNTADPQVALYHRVLSAADGSSAVFSGFSQSGFQTIMNIADVLKTVADPTTLTGPQVLKTFQALNNQPNFMAHPYTCAPAPVAIFPSVCNYYDRIVQYNNGSVTDVYQNWIAGSGLMG